MSRELHEKLQQTVVASGLWNGGAGKRNFLLSPEVYELSAIKAERLNCLGRSVKNCFSGLSQMAVEVSNPKLGHCPAWRLIRAALTNGIPKMYAPLQKINPYHESMITKIDFMEGTDGNFWIAEIDGYNPRGMGYSTLAAHMSKQISDSIRLPGVALSLATKLRALNLTKITFLYGDHERFYLPELTIFQNEMAKFGVKVTLVSELDITINMVVGLFVVLPQLNKNIALGQHLANAYQTGLISFLIPPKPYLGSKGTLALIKNQEENSDLEKVFADYIDQESLECVRSYIPETYMVGKPAGKMQGKNALNLCGWKKAIETDPNCFVLKRSISSGMKGVFFADDLQYAAAMREAENSQGHFVLQREVNQLGREIKYYLSPDEIKTAVWHTRVTAHYIGDQLADVVTTARQDKRVHGATDCLQLGTILT